MTWRDISGNLKLEGESEYKEQKKKDFSSSKMAQNQYAIMEWTTDNNLISIHHLKHIVSPVKAWNAYRKGDEGTCTWPGKGDYSFIIHAVGCRFPVNSNFKECCM